MTAPAAIIRHTFHSSTKDITWDDFVLDAIQDEQAAIEIALLMLKGDGTYGYNQNEPQFFETFEIIDRNRLYAALVTCHEHPRPFCLYVDSASDDEPVNRYFGTMKAATAAMNTYPERFKRFAWITHNVGVDSLLVLVKDGRLTDIGAMSTGLEKRRDKTP